MGENDQFKWNGNELHSVLGDDIEKNIDEKFSALKKVI
jgi:hypothetical protein